MAICNELDAGISKTCDNNTGGVKKIYIAEKDNVSSITHGSPYDTITAISMVSTKKFYEFVFNKNTSTFTESTTGDQAVGSQVCTQTLTLVLNRREQAKREVLLKLGNFKDLAVIVLDSNDKYFFLGETEGLNMTENSSESGTVKTDRNGYTITFVGEEPEMASEVDSTIIAALLV